MVEKKPSAIRALSDEEALQESSLEYEHRGGLTLEFWLGELARRDQANATRTMKQLTIWITVMTAVMTIATVVNVVLFAAK